MNEIVHIPTTSEILNQQKILIRSIGVSLLQTAFFKGRIPRANPNTGEIGRDTPLYKSALGTPVFSNLDIQAGSYTKNNQKYLFEEIKFDTVLFDVSLAKNIIKTPIQGLDGTIKEYISDDDYSVNIKGVMVAPNNTFPLDDFVALIKVVKAPVPIKVNSWWLEKFGIYNLVITSFSFQQKAGRFSEQSFEINAISDNPVELNI